MIYLQLFWEFFKTGLFMVGGGMAALPFLFDLAEKYPWFTSAQLADMVAVSESTPGPLAINMATFAGFTAAGIVGSVIATLSIILPSFLISLLICRLLARLSGSQTLEDIFRGLRPAVAGLIASVSFSLLELTAAADAEVGFSSGCNWQALILFGLLLFGVFRFDKHPILYIAIGAAAGIALGL